MAYWLVKSEPSVYGILDLKKERITAWTGVRNYQARNNLNAMKIGDKVLIYHSVDEPIGIAGLAKVVKLAYPDELQFDRKSEYFDAGASKEKPRWVSPDIEFVENFARVLPLRELKADKALNGLVLLQKGSRLSVQPLSQEHFEHIISLAKN